MNMVGEHGKGESVWLGFSFTAVLMQFTEVARMRGDLSFAGALPRGRRLKCAGISSRMAGTASGTRRLFRRPGSPLGSVNNPNVRLIRLPKAGRFYPGAGDAGRSRPGNGSGG